MKDGFGNNALTSAAQLVNVKGKDRDTALMRAAGNDHLDVVRYLAEKHHADVDGKDIFGDTALMSAVTWTWFDI